MSTRSQKHHGRQVEEESLTAIQERLPLLKEGVSIESILRIRATGAYLLYTAPYSPDLNPIELCFNVYKSYLKKHEHLFKYDWYGTHLIALEHINRDIVINKFRRCRVPNSHEVLTSSEINELVIAILLTSKHLF